MGQIAITTSWIKKKLNQTNAVYTTATQTFVSQLSLTTHRRVSRPTCGFSPGPSYEQHNCPSVSFFLSLGPLMAVNSSGANNAVVVHICRWTTSTGSNKQKWCSMSSKELLRVQVESIPAREINHLEQFKSQKCDIKYNKAQWSVGCRPVVGPLGESNLTTDESVKWRPWH